MLTLYLVFMAGGVHIVGYIVTGHFLPHAIIGLGLMWLNALLLLNTSLLGGSSLSTLANGVLAFGLYGVAFIGGWVEQFGAMLQNQTAVNIGIIVSLIFPSEALWKRAAYEMQSPLAGSLGFSPFAAPSVPSTMMIVYACGYVIITFLVALRAFGRRDL
jgi:Cu-processing system permease protein